jgi:hypothetical protein
MKSTGLIVLSILLAFCEQASAAQSQMQLTYRGTTSMSAPAVSATQDIGLEIRPGLDVDAVFSRLAKGAVSPARVPADHVPTPSDSGVSTTVGGAGFDGLTHRDQRLASSGNGSAPSRPTRRSRSATATSSRRSTLRSACGRPTATSSCPRSDSMRSSG